MPATWWPGRRPECHGDVTNGQRTEARYVTSAPIAPCPISTVSTAFRSQAS
ncbi:hypothetical protein AB0L10_23255 [Streptomyces flaveolus]|uniref:hypothetical protein n=1 Tax=Streptomyces flaveolus TaxID=67297 RepID=UPI003413F619